MTTKYLAKMSSPLSESQYTVKNKKESIHNSKTIMHQRIQIGIIQLSLLFTTVTTNFTT